jgi:CRISP-associated protein Cas1
MGFDPALGLMHADKRYRASLASDLMEPARPAADAIAVELFGARELRRGAAFVPKGAEVLRADEIEVVDGPGLKAG